MPRAQPRAMALHDQGLARATLANAQLDLQDLQEGLRADSREASAHLRVLPPAAAQRSHRRRGYSAEPRSNWGGAARSTCRRFDCAATRIQPGRGEPAYGSVEPAYRPLRRACIYAPAARGIASTRVREETVGGRSTTESATKHCIRRPKTKKTIKHAQGAVEALRNLRKGSLCSLDELVRYLR